MYLNFDAVALERRAQTS